MSARPSAVSSAPEAHFRFRGTALFGGALLAGRLAQAAAFFVMARYLDAPSMGAVAVLTVLYIALFQLTNLGFDRYIVYAPTTGDADMAATVDTVWTMQLLRGAIVLVLVAPLALALAWFPKLGVAPSHALGVAMAILTLSVVNPELASFERRGEFGYVALARGLSAVAGSVTMILLVVFWPNAWVYVLGQVVNAAALVVLSFHYASRRPRLRFEKDRMREVFSYGKHMVVIATVSLLAAQAQNVYVGSLFGPATLGSYFLWHRVVNLPGEFVTQLQDRLLFAKASEQSRRDDRVAPAHLVGFALTMGLLLPFYVFVWFHGDVLVTVLAGQRWVGDWWMGKAFVLLSFFYAIIGTITPFALVKVPGVVSRLRTVEAIGGFALLLVLGGVYGLNGVLSALIAEMVITAAFAVGILYRHIVRKNRARHAQMAVGVLLIVLAPLLLWEALGAPFLLNPFVAAATSALFFVGVTVGAARMGMSYRNVLLGHKE